MNCSPAGSSVHGILQARILEWVAISFSRGSSQPRDRTLSPALQADSLPSEPPRKLPMSPKHHLNLTKVTFQEGVCIPFRKITLSHGFQHTPVSSPSFFSDSRPVESATSQPHLPSPPTGTPKSEGPEPKGCLIRCLK